MKKLLFVFTGFSLALALSCGRAEEVALLTVHLANERRTPQIALELAETAAPETVENFKKLARKKFYNHLAFHRVFPHLLVQTGDPQSHRRDRTGVGTGGPGYTLPPEIHLKHVKGAVSMARLPDRINPSRLSNGSQFFVCLAPMPNYDGQYTVFGKVLWGLDVLDFISTKPVDSNDYPLERAEIVSIKIMPREKLPPAPGPLGPELPQKKPWWQFF